ncbi:retrotransposon protein, putative, ty1-copia subclass [Tanacetum coccineum]
MLKLHEKGIPKKAKTPAVLAIREGKIQKDKKKLRGTKDNLAKDSDCHHCKEVGYWRRNCPSYQVKLKKRKNASVASTSGVAECGGREYPSHEFVNHMKTCGIVSQLTPPYTPQHNGVSERRNQNLLDMVRSMMNLTTLPKSFWGYALKSTTRILYMVPTKKVERTPYEIWHGKAPKLSYLRVWGYEALVKRDTPDKLNPRSIKCIFVGYPKETMGYYFYYPLENKIFVARNAEFFKNSLMVQEASGSHGLLKLRDLHEPPNYKAALSNPEFDKWLEAINTEMQSMKDNQVWVLVDLPPNGRTVGSKWLFKKNTDMVGNVHTFKARLVAKGYTQTYDVDYGETFSPVADIRAIRILLTIAAFYDYEIWQMDVKTAFLNGYLSEDVYMVQHEGFMDPKHPNKVYKLQRSIYGLKQATRTSGNNVAFLILYVDDMLLMGNNITMLSKRLIDLSQSAYLEKILKKFWMENSKKRYTPLIEKADYRKSQGAKTPTEYIAAAEASMEAVWMRKFIVGLGGAVPLNKRHMEMLCDINLQ